MFTNIIIHVIVGGVNNWKRERVFENWGVCDVVRDLDNLERSKFLEMCFVEMSKMVINVVIQVN